MPITDILTKNADFYPNDVSLVEINPKLEDNRNMTWREFALTQSTAAETYRKEITWGEFQKKSNRFANLLLSRGIKKGDKVGKLYTDRSEVTTLYRIEQQIRWSPLVVIVVSGDFSAHPATHKR